jgi:anti-sigma factor RsiW
MKHAEITELLGAWALDAVEPDEAVTVERHLATCPRCRLEVAEHRDVAARLAFEGESAPDGVWDRIAVRLEETPPPRDMAKIVPLDDDAAAGDGVGDRGRRRRSLRVSLRTAVAVGAVAAVVITALGIEVDRLDTRTRHLTAAVERGDLVGRIATEPGTRTVTLRAPAGATAAQTTVFVAGGGDSVFDGRGLPALPTDREYQLWAIRGGVAVSLRLLGSRPELAELRIGPDDDELAVPDEPAGGVVVPGPDVVVSGAV